MVVILLAHHILERTKMKYEQLDHLKLIESQISRMSECSFKVKNWSLTIIGSGFVFWLKNENKWELALMIAMLTLIFWGIDAYYLNLERKYRKLYDDVLNNSSKYKTYVLDTTRFDKDFSVLYTAITSKILRRSYFFILIFEIIVFAKTYLRFKI